MKEKKKIQAFNMNWSALDIWKIKILKRIEKHVLYALGIICKKKKIRLLIRIEVH